MSIVWPVGNERNSESPWPTSSTVTWNCPRGRFGRKGCVAISAASEATATIAAHSAARIGADGCLRAIAPRRSATTARAQIASATIAAKNVTTSHAGGSGARYVSRGNFANHVTSASSQPTKTLNVFASAIASFPHKYVASSVRNPSGTITAVSSTAGTLLTGPEI